MAKKLQAIKTVDKLKALAQKLSEDIESQSEKLSDETKDEILSLIDRFLSLASNLPTELMLHADEVEEGTFTIAFLEQLSDEQLAELKEAVELHKDEDGFPLLLHKKGRKTYAYNRAQRI